MSEITITESLIVKDTGKALLIKMLESSNYKNYMFWTPKKVKYKYGFTHLILNKQVYELKAYGKNYNVLDVKLLTIKELIYEFSGV